jgi:hypothetical protein
MANIGKSLIFSPFRFLPLRSSKTCSPLKNYYQVSLFLSVPIHAIHGHYFVTPLFFLCPLSLVPHLPSFRFLSPGKRGAETPVIGRTSGATLARARTPMERKKKSKVKRTRDKSALGCGAWRTLFPLKIWRKGKKCVPLPSYYEKGNKK